ncbi:cAMP-regulated D2 protein-like [Protopterus annectens]|uniref:cAMP-regulated D2 protein-like n=1 Tax=Protopterus annectens TaxID=7888 RepID=UPI001CFBA23E|nr:cAMP-regulated D2 protein-like [Protopterus annectens]
MRSCDAEKTAKISYYLLLFLLVLFYELHVHGSVIYSNGPTVRTVYGIVKGVVNEKAQAFYGIPYAAPPVGPLRWKPPSKVIPWSDTYDATYPRAGCIQYCGEPTMACPLKTSEDCLYLNVFVPLDVNLDEEPSELLPVMVWMHGGNFIDGTGSAILYDGRFIANFTHTVIVTINYRMGALGFLVTGTDDMKSANGNYGFLDQQYAFMWVQQNIAAFGGNPNKVTLFGQSAGGQSVGLHLTVQSSAMLFQQAIIQSLPFSVTLKPKNDAIRLGKEFLKLVNCSVDDLACLLSLAPEKVLAAQAKAGSKIINPFNLLEQFEVWGPYIDGELIKEQTITAFIHGRWQKGKPVMMGTTSGEGILFIYMAFADNVTIAQTLGYAAAIFKLKALEIIFKYTPFVHHGDQRPLISQVGTDYVFLCPTRKAALSVAALDSPLWLYVFDRVPVDFRPWGDKKYCYHHVCHGTDVPFVWNSLSLTNFTFTAEEQLLANQMSCFWGQFAHTGDPNGATNQTKFCSQQPLPKWPQYTKGNNWQVMNFTVPLNTGKEYREEICDFWDKMNIYS